VLEQVPLFSGLDADDLAAIERRAVRKRYRRNTVIIERGDDASQLFFLIEGRVKVYVVGDDGREMVFGERGPGSYVGELALLTGDSRSASVETLADTEFLVLGRETFNQVITEHPQIALVLLRDLARRACALSEDVSDFALLDVYGRIAKLLQNSARDEAGQRITGRLTHQDIADRVGASREMVSRILKDLRTGGYIAVEKKRIVILRDLPERW
jgi:CRP/FNR family cyclic AMP-dependent transcriptional regulator